MRDGADARYLVVDYKTNWLGPADEPLTAHSYRPEALAAAMGHSDYPLQALLYAAVLHRFLRWRQPGYDPERHLGGVLYLYLRGMCGPETPVVDGQPVRRLRVAAAGRAGRGAVRPARRRVAAEVADDRAVRADRRARLADRHARHRAAGATSTRPALLTAADVHVASRIGALGGETDERVLLAVALAVRAVRRGSVCLDLGTGRRERAATRARLARPRRVGGRHRGVAAAWQQGVLRWEHGLLYLDRYHRLESQVCDDLPARPPSRRPRSTRRGWRPRSS